MHTPMNLPAKENASNESVHTPMNLPAKENASNVSVLDPRADHLLFPPLPCLFSVTVAAVNTDSSAQPPRVLLHKA